VAGKTGGETFVAVKKYMVLSHHRERSPEFEPKQTKAAEQDLRRGIKDTEEAMDYIERLRGSGVNPVISMPRKFLEALKQEGAAKARETWIPKLTILVGTIGIPPYSPEPDRIFFEVTNPKTRVEPRFTGKDKKFHGIVWFPEGLISIDDLREVSNA
jgi:hypothetical protein